MRLLTIAIIALALRASAQDKLAGRWEGVVEIPGRELSVVVDLAKNNAAQWEGSITFPELRIAGAALSEFTVNAADASFAIKSALADQRTGPAKFKGQLKDENHLAGEFVQAGNTAPFRLTRAGPAQVFTPPHSSVISKELEGEWHGEYELFGYPRKVTLKLQNRGADGATADFVIVGRKTNNLPVDLVRQENDFITVESHETGLSFEGHASAGAINGTITQGPIEVPVTLHR